MPLTFDEAQRIAESSLPQGQALDPTATREEPDGWYFCDRSVAYLQTGDTSRDAVGGGGFMVNKQSGRVHRFGSAFSLERNLEVYGEGIHHDWYDLLVTKVYNLDRAVSGLQALTIWRPTETEVAHGREWRIPKPYADDELRGALAELPARFERVPVFQQWERYVELRRSWACETELIPLGGAESPAS